MEQKLKQRICIEFCVKLQISATETFEMLNKAFPKDAPKRTTVFEWHSRFKAGRISIEDDPRQGRPKFQRTDVNVQKITDLIKENPRTTLLELEQDTGISKTTIGRIVTEDLKLKKTPEKFIPRFLTNEQKLCRLATCEDMMEMTRTDPEWKDKIITGDETWVYGYDPETKPQSAEWRGQTVIKEMYLGILRRLREAIRKKRPEKWTNGGWILHHDNARPHTAHLMTSFLAKNGTQILLQPPYFPDIAPNDFFLFPKLKAVLKGRHFDTRDDIIEKSPLALKSIPKEAYKNCFDNWEKRWRWILLTILSCFLMQTNHVLAGACYLLSSGLDAIDGHAARMLNQSTKFGAMLDQLTDRCTTLILLFTLSSQYPAWAAVFQLSAVLDIASHWLHLHVSLLQGKTSHKFVDPSGNPIMKLYYTSRPVLFTMCAGNELFFWSLYLLYFTSGPLVMGLSLLKVLLWISAPIMAGKAVISVIHLVVASINLGAIDQAERQHAH
ncbi:hypothetical protein LAZ67_9001515 [Cordylochernes scorpioides]|uniref:Mos1 transposase HTH domain-containing protein n=1 Tax=Cordylochernes scorpioides TaxID=51811 RepID=A0ABY6KT19_9ARAC|nr:hypothetical protein LAZ67_9001515 [Cordylochernes scorpioides]